MEEVLGNIHVLCVYWVSTPGYPRSKKKNLVTLLVINSRTVFNLMPKFKLIKHLL